MAYCEIKSINAPEKTYGDHLVVKNISVVDSWSYPDCSYKERIKLQFYTMQQGRFYKWNGLAFYR